MSLSKSSCSSSMKCESFDQSISLSASHSTECSHDMTITNSGIEYCANCGLQCDEIIRSNEERREQKRDTRIHSRFFHLEYYNEIPMDPRIKDLANKLYASYDQAGHRNHGLLYLFAAYAANVIKNRIDPSAKFDPEMVAIALKTKRKAIDNMQQTLCSALRTEKVFTFLDDYLKKQNVGDLQRIEELQRIKSPLIITPIQYVSHLTREVLKVNKMEKQFMEELKIFGSTEKEILNEIISSSNFFYNHVMQYSGKCDDDIKSFKTAYPQTSAMGLVYFVITVDGAVEIPQLDVLPTTTARNTYMRYGMALRNFMQVTFGKKYIPRYEKHRS